MSSSPAPTSARAPRRSTSSRSSLRVPRSPRSGSSDLPILLLLASRNDTSAATERFRAAVPRATVDTLDSEHDLLAHAPDETIRLVADWLLGLAAR